MKSYKLFIFAFILAQISFASHPFLKETQGLEVKKILACGCCDK